MRRWCPLLTLLPLFGCAVGPDYQAATPPVSASWTNRSVTVEPASSVSSWWRRFNDPVLDRLIAQAVTANSGVAQAAAKIREARASLMQQKSGLFPAFDSSGDWTRSRQYLGNQSGTPPSGGLASSNDNYYTGNNFQVGFDASFELDLFGGQRRSIESANASLDAAGEDLGDTLLTLLGDVARYYVEARGYQGRVAVAKDTLASRTDTWRLTRAMAQSGTGTGLDEIEARAEMESAATAIPPLEYDFRKAVNRLAVLTGLTPQEALDAMHAPRSIPRFAGTIRPDPTVVVLARRPDVRAAERRVAAATAEIGVAEADRLPAVTIAGTLGLNSSRIRSLGNSASNVWSFEPQFSLPIFDAGKRAAKADEKVAARDEKLAAWQAIVRNAIEEAENALVALDRERAHYLALKRTVRAYGDALKVSQAKYQAGLATFLDVLSADRSLATQRDNLVQSDAALATDAIALYKALGGGWQDVGISFADQNPAPSAMSAR